MAPIYAEGNARLVAPRPLMSASFSTSSPFDSHLTSSTLSRELDKLSDANQQLSRQLQDTENACNRERGRAELAEKRTRALSEDMRQIKNQRLDMERSSFKALDAALKEIKQLRAQVNRQTKAFETTKTAATKFSAEKDQLERSLVQSQKKSSQCGSECTRLRGLLGRVEEDKKRLAGRIDKLTANERSLVMELERLKLHGALPPPNRNGKRINQLDAYVSGIEADRDYWKDQVDVARQLVNALGDQRGQEGKARRSSCHTTVNRRNSARYSPAPTNGCHIQVGQNSRIKMLEEQIEALRQDRDSLRRELANSKCTCSPQPPRSRSLTRVQNNNEMAELYKLKRERDDLRTMLDTLERRVQEIQRNIHTLTKERDQTSKLYNEARREVQRLQHDLASRQELGEQATQSNRCLLTRVEAERDRALDELGKVTSERDALVGKLRTCSDQASSDKHRLSGQLDLLDQNLRKLNDDRNNMECRMNDLRRKYEGVVQENTQLEQLIDQEKVVLKSSNDEVKQLRQEHDHQKRRVHEKEQECIGLGEHVRELEHELYQLRERIDDTEQKLRMERDETNRLRSQGQKLTSANENSQSEINRLVTERAELCKAKRKLEKSLQEVSVDCGRLGRECDDVKHQNHQLEQQLAEFDKAYEEQTAKYQNEKKLLTQTQTRLDSALEAKGQSERRLDVLERQLADLQDKLSQTEATFVAEQARTKWLTDTIERLQEDNKTLRATVELANKDKINLESCIEDLTSANRDGQRERDDLEHRSTLLSGHIDRLEATVKQMDGEVGRLNDLVKIEQSSSSDLKETIEQMRRRDESRGKDLIEANRQASQSSSQITRLERELGAERDRCCLLEDRCESLEGDKQNMEITLGNANGRIAHLEVDLEAQIRECDQLQQANQEYAETVARTQEALGLQSNELTNTRAELVNCQAALAQARDQMDQESAESGQLRDQLDRLTRQVQAMQTDLQESSTERDELRDRISDYLGELARLERALQDREQEGVKMTDQLCRSGEEVNGWRLKCEKVEARLNSLTVDLEHCETELKDERDKADARERELVSLRVKSNSMELRNNSVARSAAEANEQLQVAKAELGMLNQELLRQRDSVTRLESDRSTAQREVTSLRLECDQLRTQLEDAEIDDEQAKHEAEKERVESRKLATLLAGARQKETSLTLELQKKTSELANSREKQVASDEHVDKLQLETDRLKDRLAESEREMGRMSRALSLERFEKERVLSELRLTSLAPATSDYRSSRNGENPSLSGATYQLSTPSKDFTTLREREVR